MIDAATWGPRKCVLPLPSNTLLIQKQKVGDEAIDFFYERSPIFKFEQDILAPFRKTERWVCRMQVARSGSIVGGALDPVERPGKEPTTILQEIEIPSLPEAGKQIGGFIQEATKPFLILAGAAVVVLLAFAFAKAS